MQTVAIFVGVVLVSGLVWGVIGIVDHWILRGDLPQGEWWHFLVAIPFIGIVALAFEALGAGIGYAFGVNKPGTPKWKEYLGVVTVIAAAIAILVVLKSVRS